MSLSSTVSAGVDSNAGVDATEIVSVSVLGLDLDLDLDLDPDLDVTSSVGLRALRTWHAVHALSPSADSVGHRRLCSLLDARWCLIRA